MSPKIWCNLKLTAIIHGTYVSVSAHTVAGIRWRFQLDRLPLFVQIKRYPAALSEVAATGLALIPNQSL